MQSDQARAPEKLSDSEYSVAVVIPVYNGAEFLQSALESVVCQTYPPAEIIVVDDGSSDDSAMIASQLSGVRVITQKNSGVSESRNRGVVETSASWIAFLDQDDLWDPRKLQLQIQSIRRWPDTDICISGKQELSRNRLTGDWEAGKVSPLPESVAVRILLYGTLRFVPSCVLIRRDVFMSVGGFHKEASPCEDWDLWLRLEQAGATFTVEPEPLLLYRQHANNTSNNSLRMYDAELRAFDVHIGPKYGSLNRAWRRLQAKSRFRAGVSLVEREQNRPHLVHLLHSILIFPFGDWRRYKVLIHMLLRN